MGFPTPTPTPRPSHSQPAPTPFRLSCSPLGHPGEPGGPSGSSPASSSRNSRSSPALSSERAAGLPSYGRLLPPACPGPQEGRLARSPGRALPFCPGLGCPGDHVDFLLTPHVASPELPREREGETPRNRRLSPPPPDRTASRRDQPRFLPPKALPLPTLPLSFGSFPHTPACTHPFFIPKAVATAVSGSQAAETRRSHWKPGRRVSIYSGTLCGGLSAGPGHPVW